MSQKEFSSGGSEYFPAGQEFSAPKQEFTRPAPEVIPSAAETDQSGNEFRQSTGADKTAQNKRRRISPAMLTTAAVVTAAVAVLPLTSNHNMTPDRYDYPTMELSAVGKAYLDEAWEVLRNGDVDRLAALGTDGRMLSFSENEVAPYVDMLEQTYGRPKSDDAAVNNELYTYRDDYHGAILYYDGQNAGWHKFEEENLLNFHYNAYVENEYPDDLYTNTLFYFTESVEENAYYSSYANIYTGIANYYGPDEYKRNDHLVVNYEKGRYISIDPQINGYVLDFGTIWNESWTTDPETGEMIDHDWVRAEGDFALTLTYGSDEEGPTAQVQTYLHDGSVIFFREYEDCQGEFRLNVEDGILQLSDEIGLSYNEHTDRYGLYAHYYDADGNVIRSEGLATSEQNLTEDEVLDIRNWHLNYVGSNATYSIEE